MSDEPNKTKKGALIEAMPPVNGSTSSEPARLTQPAVSAPERIPKSGSLLSQARQLAVILGEQEQMIAASELRVFGLQHDGETFAPPDDASLGIRLRMLLDHAVANCERMESLLKAL